MPELPEVETVKRSIEGHICGKKILRVEVANENVLDAISKEEFIDLLKDCSIKNIERRGKYLIFCLENGKKLILHLRMTGQLIWFEDAFNADRHCHVVVSFEKGGFYYRDVRRFGRFCPVGSGGKTEEGLMALGCEPFDPQFTEEYLKKGLAGRRLSIKNRILDQHFIAGIGNIYADEILFAAGIHPELPCMDLTDDQILKLKDAAKCVLKDAIRYRGTTFSDFRDGYGETGSYQEHLAVFHRDGMACPVCGAVIEKIKCGGRTTSFCPQCQKR